MVKFLGLCSGSVGLWLGGVVASGTVQDGVDRGWLVPVRWASTTPDVEPRQGFDIPRCRSGVGCGRFLAWLCRHPGREGLGGSVGVAGLATTAGAPANRTDPHIKFQQPPVAAGNGHIKTGVDPAGDNRACFCDRGHVRPAVRTGRAGTARRWSDSPGTGAWCNRRYQVPATSGVPAPLPPGRPIRSTAAVRAGGKKSQAGRENDAAVEQFLDRHHRRQPRPHPPA